ncbi:flavin-containing monooxygenase [Rhodococcus sp. NPDC127528]|uniref:flavin-containing monooxygenase n=1 Tax=unclassified Rhodococcus (in: high G+C Gram-positive bacteria) TaxID=192944 RepID=UPI003645098A
MPFSVTPRRSAPTATTPAANVETLPRVCVIGAGSSGIAAAKALHVAGIPFDCFEQGSVIGGNWVYDNPNGVSACYETLEINTSCPRMAFSDFPMPADYPPYARHDQVRAYFESYVEHFGFRHTITFGTTVEHVEQAPDGTWSVRTTGAAGERVESYDAVLVANGHHWDPRWPDPTPGSFTGEQIHSHDYRSAEQLDGRDVVVVGMGNSGLDIAVEASEVARSTSLSVRRSHWVMRKMLLGKPADRFVMPGWLPGWVISAGLRVSALTAGDLTRYGLPRPTHRPGQAHPVQSEQIRARLRAGAISPRPKIDRFEGDTVVFADGTRSRADLIVWATGYRVSFPFFDPELVAAPENDLPLWKRTVHPDLPGLYFVGLLQPLGAVMPLAEAQGAWIAETLAGRYRPPSDAEIRSQMTAEHDRAKRRFYSSPRHTMEVDFEHYLWSLGRERRRGARRARVAG